MEIYLLEEVNGKKYKELMNYALNKNNVLTVNTVNYEKRIISQKKENNRIIDLICNFFNEDKNNLTEKYKENREETLNKIFSKIKFRKNEYKEYYEMRAKDSVIRALENSENYTEEEKIYIEKVKNVLKIFEKDLIKKEVYGFIDKHYYKITLKEKEFLLKKSNLYDYEYPSPENMCLLDNEKLWLETITHERMCTIYGNKEDEEFLNKIKVKYEKYLNKDYTVKMIKQEINKWDPVGLLKMGVPKNEYDIEIYSIVDKIQVDSSADEISNIIYEEFINMFGEDIVGDIKKFKQECNEIAKKIFWKL